MENLWEEHEAISEIQGQEVQLASGDGNQQLGCQQGPWQLHPLLLCLCSCEVSNFSFPPRLLLSSLSAFSAALDTWWEMAASSGPSCLLPSVFPWPTTVPGTKCSSSQQKLPRISKMSQGLIRGKASDWSSRLRCPSLIQSAMAKGRVLCPGIGGGIEEEHLWEGGSSRFLKKRMW